MKRILFAATLAVASFVMAAPASAISITFTTSGPAPMSQSGTATFDSTPAVAGTFTVTLNNLTSPTSFTEQELTGLTFTLTPASSPTLQSVSAAATLDCTSDNVAPCAPYAGVVPTNSGWAATTAAGVTTLTTTPLGFHPFAIINSNYTLPANGNGNLANGEHNPFLVGPVVFTFAGDFTSVSNVTFNWGTSGTTTPGGGQPQGGSGGGSGADPVVPEPATLVLLGSGLALAAAKARSRKTAKI